MGVSGVLVQVEVHKRFDPIYVDARDRIKKLGGCSYMCAPTPNPQPSFQPTLLSSWPSKRLTTHKRRQGGGYTELRLRTSRQTAV